jgi:TetR/AcrR family transcriptional regulator
VAAALDTLQTTGAAGLSLREVARRLGVSLPSVQRHFPTKDDLWRACVDVALADVYPAGPTSGDGDRLIRHLQAQFGRRLKAGGLTAAILNDTEPGADGRLAYLTERARPIMDQARADVSAAVDAGVVRPVDPVVFVALVGIGLGSLASSRDGLRRLFGVDLDAPDQADRFAMALADLILHGLLREP